uniref:Ribosomal protein L2 n=1 Tax=Piridium sociabile TaxID=2570542 RepID=A0A5B9XWG5_9ALVE|nr:ribosomal protein L2 [Piridium sociabile]
MILYSNIKKKLIIFKKIKYGRNFSGKKVLSGRCAGSKKKLRNIDFFYAKNGVLSSKAQILDFVYDPYRLIDLALIFYKNGCLINTYRYILKANIYKINDIIEFGELASLREGNLVPLYKVNNGSLVSNIEIYPGSGAKYIRSGGSKGKLLSKGIKYCVIKLPSNKLVYISVNCFGILGSLDVPRVIVNKNAGYSKWKGRRPHVRGSAMNPVDHPHGGGEGKTSIGRCGPYSPWGKLCFGKKTVFTKKNRIKVI